MIISQHIGKTAGTSFRVFLNSQFKNCTFIYPCPKCKRISVDADYRVLFDDCDMHLDPKDIIAGIDRIDPKTTVIHGHLGHYLPLFVDRYPPSEHQYVAWLRNPYQRAVSYYYFMAKRGLQRNSFEEFIQHREMQADWLKPLSIDDFTFIGIVEQATLSIDLFNKAFGLPRRPLNIHNANAKKQNFSYDVDPEWLEVVKHYWKEDFELYERGMVKFYEQLRRY